MKLADPCHVVMSSTNGRYGAPTGRTVNYGGRVPSVYNHHLNLQCILGAIKFIH